MRALTFSFFGATTQLAWTADKQTNLVGTVSTSTNAHMVATDPTLVTSDLTSPGSAQIKHSVLIYGISTTVRVPVSIPIDKGTTIFVSGPAGASVIVYLDS